MIALTVSLLMLRHYAGRRRKKERKKVNNSEFRPFQVGNFRIISGYTLSATVDWGSIQADSSAFRHYYNAKITM